MRKPTVQAVTGALRSCGLRAARRSRRQRRRGFQVFDPRTVGIRARGIAVNADDTDSPVKCSDIYAECLERKGFEVKRPFPDNTVLLVGLPADD